METLNDQDQPLGPTRALRRLAAHKSPAAMAEIEALSRRLAVSSERPLIAF
jgi:hypothetical protein